MRRLVEETRVSPAELVLPLFLKEGLTEPRPISSLPGVVQHSRESLRKAAHEAVSAGVGGLMLFGVPTNEHKDETGSAGLDPDGILNVGIRDLIAEVGDSSVVMSDLCLDEFTSHGHCGVLAGDGSVDNESNKCKDEK
jgi:porphobilinogen synthase